MIGCWSGSAPRFHRASNSYLKWNETMADYPKLDSNGSSPAHHPPELHMLANCVSQYVLWHISTWNCSFKRRFRISHNYKLPVLNCVHPWRFRKHIGGSSCTKLFYCRDHLQYLLDFFIFYISIIDLLLSLLLFIYFSSNITYSTTKFNNVL